MNIENNELWLNNKIDRSILKQNKKEQLKLFFKRFFKNKLAVIGSIIILTVIFIAIFANFLSPYNPYEINPNEAIAPLSKAHIFGTDQFGRDTLSRIFFGARISIIVGFLATSIAAFFGILIGGISGFYGGLTDIILMRIMDTILSFPAILLAIVLVAVLGPSLVNAIVAIGIIYIPMFARVVRSAVLDNKENDYVLAAKALGKSKFRILFMEIIPNCMAPIIVQATFNFADAIIIEAGLSFIGIGAPPPSASWGKMLNEARAFMSVAPLQAVFPGSAIALVVIGFNLFGDGFRDLLDPRLRRGTI